jgi:hypothetical protein
MARACPSPAPFPEQKTKVAVRLSCEILVACHWLLLATSLRNIHSFGFQATKVKPFHRRFSESGSANKLICGLNAQHYTTCVRQSSQSVRLLSFLGHIAKPRGTVTKTIFLCHFPAI